MNTTGERSKRLSIPPTWWELDAFLLAGLAALFIYQLPPDGPDPSFDLQTVGLGAILFVASCLGFIVFLEVTANCRLKVDWLTLRDCFLMATILVLTVVGILPLWIDPRLMDRVLVDPPHGLKTLGLICLAFWVPAILFIGSLGGAFKRIRPKAPVKGGEIGKETDRSIPAGGEIHYLRTVENCPGTAIAS